MNPEEDAGWELRVPQWRGLGLADPIRAVEVGLIDAYDSFRFDCFVGQVVTAPSLPQGQGPGQAAH